MGQQNVASRTTKQKTIQATCKAQKPRKLNMLIKASIDIDIDTENIDIEDMRSAIVECMLEAIEQNPELILLEPIEP